MNLISYAQNYEDVVLFRALRDVLEGFYIDVGAMSPDFDSVTKAFYERGWHGINIEPNPECEAAFTNSRPRDINLTLAIGETPGRLRLNVFSETGLSTFDNDIAAEHLRSGLDLTTHEVEIVTLRQVFDRHVVPGEPVHFVKIDVEGFEAQVIRSNDWEQNRPWIVVAEATHPRTQIPSYEDWEPVLIAARYRHVYSDGLNRFYLAEEHLDLAPRFAVPPNVFDEFKPYAHHDAEQRHLQAEQQRKDAEQQRKDAEQQRKDAEQQRDDVVAALGETKLLLEAAQRSAAESALQAMKAQEEIAITLSNTGTQVAQLVKQINALNEQAAGLNASLQSVTAELHSTYNSRSWRISYPLRLCSLVLQDALKGLPVARGAARSLARRALLSGARLGRRLLRHSPLVHAHAQAWLRARPALADRVQHLLSGPGTTAGGSAGRLPLGQARLHSMSVAEMPKGAREIYFALREAIDRKRVE